MGITVSLADATYAAIVKVAASLDVTRAAVVAGLVSRADFTAPEVVEAIRVEHARARALAIAGQKAGGAKGKIAARETRESTMPPCPCCAVRRAMGRGMRCGACATACPTSGACMTRVSP